MSRSKSQHCPPSLGASFLLSRNKLLPAGPMADTQEMLLLTEQILPVLILVIESTGRQSWEETPKSPCQHSGTPILSPIPPHHSGTCWPMWSPGFHEDSGTAQGHPQPHTPIGKHWQSSRPGTLRASPVLLDSWCVNPRKTGPGRQQKTSCQRH